MFAIAFTKDIRNVLNQIDGIAENPQNQTEIEEKLSEFIEQHSLGKKLRNPRLSCISCTCPFYLTVLLSNREPMFFLGFIVISQIYFNLYLW